DKEARDAGDRAKLPTLLAQLFEAGQVGLHYLAVPVDREDEGDVDVVALGDLVVDRRDPFLGGRDLHHDVRPVASGSQVFGERDRASSAVGDGWRDLDADEAVVTP